ncbi:MAG: pilus (MSHA type) biogenesis protein MshL [Nitrospirae bacterium]|nr:pilus (MSHA type) biogenesis protein MshL [Nitrospirota bacterium]
MRNLLLILLLLSFVSCTTTKHVHEAEKAWDTKEPVVSSQESTLNQVQGMGQKPEVKTPEFMPLAEELSPLKTRIISISARNTPLRDVLHVIAESTGLNLVMEKGVNPEVLVTITLKNVSAEDALNAVFTSVDYFYSIKENTLTVKAMDTRIFEFGQPSVIQDYTVDVGGDILGGATGGTLTTGAATTGTTSIKGSVTQKIEADKASFKLWDVIEKAIGGLIEIRPQAVTADTSVLQPNFSVNRLTGTIVVTATKKDLEKVERYLDALKKILNRQVLIEARIVEVQLTDSLKYGIDWSFIEDWKGVGRLTIGTERFTEVIGTTESAFQIGLTGVNFSSVLRALQQQGEVRVLSNPRVNIMNGHTALLSVGRNVNFISRVETTTTTAAGAAPTTTFTVQTSSVLSGIILGIVPYINETGEISMAITPIVSDLVRLDEKRIGTQGENIIEISLPTVDLRELSTTVKIKDGQMVIIGGLMSRKEKLQDSKVPFLGDIPLIGYLFRSRDKVDEKTELVIMLRPMILI